METNREWLNRIMIEDELLKENKITTPTYSNITHNTFKIKERYVIGYDIIKEWKSFKRQVSDCKSQEAFDYILKNYLHLNKDIILYELNNNKL